MALHRRPLLATALTCAIVVSCGPVPSPREASPVPPLPASPSIPASASGRPSPETVAAAITEAGLARRLAELEAITAQSDGYRSLGSKGYDAAVAYVKWELAAAGWSVSTDVFEAPVFTPGGGASLAVGTSAIDSAAIMPLRFAPGGTAEGPLAAVGWSAGPVAAGCAAGDYAALPPRAIVVVRSHWECSVRDEVISAQHAGASGFIAADAAPPSDVVPLIDLGMPDGLTIPAIAVSWNTALLLVDNAEQRLTARLVTQALTRPFTTTSVIAELPGADAGHVVIVGAHLDSVPFGPGINDDGSGVAALLELARALGGANPPVSIRLAFWAAEENGMSGSSHYLGSLGDVARRSIVAYLNADMIGSGNGYLGVYAEPSAARGSTSVGTLLAAAIARSGATSVDVDLTGRSDHWPFEQAGIPTGGVFAGAEDAVTPAGAATQGAVAGQPADACYHNPCDTSGNMRLPIARVLAAALADAAVRLAEDPSLVAS